MPLVPTAPVTNRRLWSRHPVLTHWQLREFNGVCLGNSARAHLRFTLRLTVVLCRSGGRCLNAKLRSTVCHSSILVNVRGAGSWEHGLERQNHKLFLGLRGFCQENPNPQGYSSNSPEWRSHTGVERSREHTVVLIQVS
jgi:hypothetical protein